MGRAGSDVVVVGAGIVGAALAYELACAGASVTVIDAGTSGRASDAGAGIASPATFAEDDDEWYRFGAAAATYLQELVARLGEDGADPGPDAYARCGSLVVALAEHEGPWFEEVAALTRTRAPDATELEPAQVEALFPPLARPWRALHCPGAARVDGRAISTALRDGAVARGASMVPGTATGVAFRGDRAVGVTTAEGAVAGDHVVLAAGAWSASLLGPGVAPLPVTPTKGEIVHVALPDPPPGSGGWPIVQPVLNFYLVAWPGGRVACGGTFDAAAGYDARPTAAGLRDLLRELLAIAPGLAQATVVETRVGLRPWTPDERPLLGRWPGANNLHVCTGHGANGLLLGPYSAALVARSLTDGAPAGSLPYDAARLAAR
jgi:D-amino-acid dehydrogenase